MRKYLEVILQPNADAFQVSKHLNTFQGMKCNVVTMDKVRVWYNIRRRKEADIIGLIAAMQKQKVNN